MAMQNYQINLLKLDTANITTLIITTDCLLFLFDGRQDEKISVA